MRIVLADVLLDRIEDLMTRATTNVAMMLGLGLPGPAESLGRNLLMLKVFRGMVEDLAFDDWEGEDEDDAYMGALDNALAELDDADQRIVELETAGRELLDLIDPEEICPSHLEDLFRR